MNTELCLMYRDGDNYKTCTEVVFKGLITQEQINAIADELEEGIYVIAHQVDLPTPSQGFADRFAWPTESDHVWTTLSDFDDRVPTPEYMQTDRLATTEVTLEEFVSKLKAVEWGVEAEMERIGLS